MAGPSPRAAAPAALLIAPTLAEPAHFSALEIALLLACLLASAALFLWRFSPILGNILRSKKDVGFSLHPITRRLWVFFWEVLCQAKVICQRPLPGLLHAFVFWGFLAFALVSLNHLAVALGFGFLPPASPLGRFYFTFAGVWAVLVAISIAGLFIRRFFVRPIWLGTKVSYESGIIAALIFLLMVTYLGAFFAPAGSPAIKALWWTHTLALLVFLPLIPHTKHLHLVLSPLTVFLKRDGFAEIPPLVGDEDFGLTTGKDLTQLISLQAYSCVECGRCTEHCPASNTGKILNPKEIILGTRSYLNTFGPHSDAPLLTEAPEPSSESDNPPANYMSMEAAFQCTTCGACEFQCPVGIQHVPILVGLRRGATNTGAWEDLYGTKLFLALEKNGNALGLSAAERDKFVQRAALPIFDGTQEYCLWLGCMGGYDPKGREIIADFARIMDYLGTSFGVLKKEKCTGDPARRLGNDLVFQNLAESGLKAFQTAKVQKIVAICPHCVRTIATDWRAYGNAAPGNEIQIEHHSEFLARHQALLPRQHGAGAQTIETEIGVGTVPASPVETIVYHDPCYLGRYQNIYDQPRAVVALAGDLVEAPRHHERSFCCGAGGGLAFLGEETGDRVSHARAKELAATGAHTVATACPFCNTMFRDSLAALATTTPTGQTPPQLLDIAQLTARNLPPKASPPA
ncbi:MAG TPA: heterodisulfide reductase-related iron-sulfur binding cluster [Granulicella sp.]|jgi:Fe-S oxidoreductase|nr:heterodisulfide reductase-related iron-sulfur binding cluster [Granulicella sp.]